MLVIGKLQNVETGKDYPLKDGMVCPPFEKAMFFFGAPNMGMRVRVKGPEVDTEKETITPSDQCVPNMPFKLVPGTYEVQLYVNTDDDVIDETVTFQVK